MRLIDADALKKALAKNLTIWAFNTSYDGVLAEVIDNAPTVDIEGYEMYGKGYCKGYLQGYTRGKNERPQGDMSKATRYHDTSIDALIDEALDELSETKHQASEETDNLCEVHLLSKKQDVPFCEVKTERGGASNE